MSIRNIFPFKNKKSNYVEVSPPARSMVNIDDVVARLELIKKDLNTLLERNPRDASGRLASPPRSAPDTSQRAVPSQGDYGPQLRRIEDLLNKLHGSALSRPSEHAITRDYLDQKFREMANTHAAGVQSAALAAVGEIKQAVVASLTGASRESDLVPEWHKALHAKIDELQRLLEEGRLDIDTLRLKHASELDAQKQGAERILQEAGARWEHERGEINRAHDEEREREHRERKEAEDALKAAHDREKAEITTSHLSERALLQEALAAEKAKVWPELLMDDALTELREAVEKSFNQRDPAGMQLYAEMLALCASQYNPQKFCDQVIALGFALYSWLAGGVTSDESGKWEDVVSTWASEKIRSYGLEVVPVRVGDRFNEALHNCAVVSGENVKQVKSFLIRTPAGVAKSRAVVVLS